MPKTLDNVRDDILSTTRSMLAESGYKELNMRAVASRCGIATGTLYNYFGSKQEIVAQVLMVEWNMMLRRIDQQIKLSVGKAEKLEIIFSELCSLMNVVHNVWIDNSTGSLSEEELRNIKIHKEALMESLKERILPIIKEDTLDKDYLFLSDVILRLFISYSYKGNSMFAKLKPVLASIIS